MSSLCLQAFDDSIDGRTSAETRWSRTGMGSEYQVSKTPSGPDVEPAACTEGLKTGVSSISNSALASFGPRKRVYPLQTCSSD